MTIPLAQKEGSDDTQSGATNMNQAIVLPVLTGAAEHNAMSDSCSVVPADEHWVNSHWRPMAAWVYLTICVFDFLVFPVLWSIIQSKFNGQVTLMWQPLTLQGGGLFHLAFGTLLGISSYGRTQEKMASLNSGSSS